MVVFVDGISRSGKSLMGSILASFDRVEIERREAIFEYIGGLYRIGKLERDAAVTLLKTEADTFLYYSMIARNTNFRFSDHSSVWKDRNKLRYFKRLFTKDDPLTLNRRIARERPIFQTMTHDQLANFSLHREAFGEDFRMIQMIRHPVDLITSWERLEWGTRFGKDPLALTLTISYDGEELPYYALGWEEEYLSASPLGRVIGMVRRLWDENMDTYRSLPPEHKGQVLVIPFEDFIQWPDTFIHPIGALLSSWPRRTKTALSRQGLPRGHWLANQAVQRYVKILDLATAEERGDVERLMREYESLCEGVRR